MVEEEGHRLVGCGCHGPGDRGWWLEARPSRRSWRDGSDSGRMAKVEPKVSRVTERGAEGEKKEVLEARH